MSKLDRNTSHHQPKTQADDHQKKHFESEQSSQAPQMSSICSQNSVYELGLTLTRTTTPIIYEPENNFVVEPTTASESECRSATYLTPVRTTTPVLIEPEGANQDYLADHSSPLGMDLFHFQDFFKFFIVKTGPRNLKDSPLIPQNFREKVANYISTVEKFYKLNSYRKY